MSTSGCHNLIDLEMLLTLCSNIPYSNQCIIEKIQEVQRHLPFEHSEVGSLALSFELARLNF